MNKRSKVIFISGAVIAIVIAAAYLYFPPVNEHDAQGAIGAVQKHQAQQIKASDVVLGDEQDRKQEAALYGDLLEDAIRLESISAEMGSFAESLGSAAFDRATVASFSETLGSYYASAANESLGIVSELQGRSELQSFSADLGSIQRGLQSESILEMKRLESFQQMVANMAESLESESALEAKGLLGAQLKLENISQQLESRELSLDNRALMQMSDDLGSMVSDLEARQSLESRFLENRMLSSRLRQLEARILEQRVLVASREKLGSLTDSLESRSALYSFSADLASRAAALESRALSNMEARFESRALAAKVLGNMAMLYASVRDSLQGRSNLESKGLQNLTAALGSFHTSLENHQPLMAQRFTLGLQSELAAISSHLEGRERLGIKQFESRNLGMKQLESRGLAMKNLANFSDYLGNLSESLESQALIANRQSDALGNRALELQNRTADLQSRFQQM